MQWYTLVWGKGYIPGYAFILWLAVRHRLNTKARLRNWGIDVSSTCVFCDVDDETLEHLASECDFSRSFWGKIQKLCLLYRGNLVRQEVYWWSKHNTSNSFCHKLRRFALSATQHHLWQARNQMVFQQVRLSSVQAVTRTVNAIRLIVVSWSKIPRIKES